MKRLFPHGLLAILFLATLTIHSVSAQVTIGSNNPPDGTAVLDLQSNSKGFLLSKLTTAQRNGIVNPAEGLQIFNTNTHCIEAYFVVSGWRAIACDCSNAPNQPGSIGGSTLVCVNAQNVVYGIAPVLGAVSYQWTVPPGATIVNGQGTDTIEVNFGTQPGTVTVQAVNTCGVSIAQSVSITLEQPSAQFTNAPNPININQNATFTPAWTAPGTQYQWTFQNGNPGTSTVQNPVVQWSNSGTTVVTLNIVTQNGCTASFSDTLTISACPPPGGNSLTFTYTGAMQTWTVPACVSQVTIQVWGAEGGYGYTSSLVGPGGLGGYVTGVKNVSPGTVLNIFVGGRGANASAGVGGTGGWNGGAVGGSYSTIHGGGGGGGGSDVRIGGTAFTNRILAAGGGGGGSYYVQCVGGAGGYPNGGNGLSTSEELWVQNRVMEEHNLRAVPVERIHRPEV